MTLSARNVELRYDKNVVVPGITLDVPENKISVLVGPNGSGKSTVMKSLARLLRPSSGQVVLDGEAIHSLSSKEVARKLAILPQVLTTPEAITVEELVWFGRHPYRSAFGPPSSEDRRIVEWALQVTNTADLRAAHVDQLS